MRGAPELPVEISTFMLKQMQVDELTLALASQVVLSS